jgi:hypothetical protein
MEQNLRNKKCATWITCPVFYFYPSDLRFDTVTLNPSPRLGYLFITTVLALSSLISYCSHSR